MAETRVYQSYVEIFGAASGTGPDPSGINNVYQSYIEIFGAISVEGTAVSSNCTLYIGGAGSPTSGVMPLYTRGLDYSSGVMPLYTKGMETISSGITLYTEGSIASSGNITLFLKQNDAVSVSGNIPLYLNATSAGVGGVSSTMPLYIRNSTGSGSLGTSPISGELVLFMQGQTSATVSGSIPLYMGVDVGSGNVSGLLPLYISADTAPTGWIGASTTSSNVTLYIRSSTSLDNNMTLFLKRKGEVGEEVVGNITLFMKNNEATGLLPLYINCQNAASSNLTLYMPSVGAGSGLLNLYTKGYSE